MKRNYLKTLAIISFMVFGMTSAVAQATKIGYLNYESLIYDLPEFKSYNDSLEAYTVYLEKKMDQIKETYNEQYAKVERIKKEKNPNLELLELAMDNLQRTQQLYQIEMNRNQLKLQQKEQDFLEPLKKIVDDAVEAVAKEKGFTMVLDANTIVYKRDLDDIEDLVRTKLKVINKKESEKKRKEAIANAKENQLD
jgi:outer membrane protein